LNVEVSHDWLINLVEDQIRARRPIWRWAKPDPERSRRGV